MQVFDEWLAVLMYLTNPYLKRKTKYTFVTVSVALHSQAHFSLVILVS
jgi:hypothetical protein